MNDHDNSTPVITYTPDGPFRLEGEAEIFDTAGNKVTHREVSLICRCGSSKKMPLCDGTHARNNFYAPSGKSRLPNRRINYRGKEILVHFNPAFCSHNGACLRMLPKVFNQGHNPWVDPDGASVDKIVDAIKHCPSGALSYTLEKERIWRIAQSPLKIRTVKYGPLEVSGAVKLIDGEKGDLKIECPDHFTLCRCGLSAHIPFCDGGHFASDMDE